VKEKKATKKGARRPTAKQQKLVEGVLRGKSVHKAALDAGYAPSTAKSLPYNSQENTRIVEAIERRRDAAMRRAQIHTDVIIGSLAEISTASLGDVLDENGEFSITTARDNGVDHLLKKVKVTTFDTKDKDGNVTSTRTTHEYEMYSRLEALNQLRDTFGLKEEPRANTLNERRRQEAEASLARIMERDRVDKVTAANTLIEELRAIPNTQGIIDVVNELIN
jgi:phage terminase small subunit